MHAGGILDCHAGSTGLSAGGRSAAGGGCAAGLGRAGIVCPPAAMGTAGVSLAGLLGLLAFLLTKRKMLIGK